MTFGEKLRKYRLEKGLTQTQLAHAAGIGLNTICNYENGRTYPQNRDVYTKLANILGIDPSYLHNENDDFVADAQQRYGHRGKKQAEELVAQIGGLFAGGELSETEKDGVMKALQEVYWKCKEENRDKYTSNRHTGSNGDNA